MVGTGAAALNRRGADYFRLHLVDSLESRAPAFTSTPCTSEPKMRVVHFGVIPNRLADPPRRLLSPRRISNLVDNLLLSSREYS